MDRPKLCARRRDPVEALSAHDAAGAYGVRKEEADHETDADDRSAESHKRKAGPSPASGALDPRIVVEAGHSPRANFFLTLPFCTCETDQRAEESHPMASVHDALKQYERSGDWSAAMARFPLPPLA